MNVSSVGIAMVRTSIVFLFLTIIMPTNAWTSVIDLDYLYNTGSGGSNGLNGAIFQTFKPQSTGKLTRLDLQLFASGFGPVGNSGARVMIVPTTAGVPDIGAASGALIASPLAEFILPSRPIGLDASDMLSGGFVALDFSPFNLSLLSGSLYAILVEQTDNDHGTLFWAYQTTAIGGYPSGQAGAINYNAVNPTPLTSDSVDYGFRTWMQATAVPIPAALPFFSLGLTLLGFAGRRRKRSI